MSSLRAMLGFEEGRRARAYPDPLTGGAPYTIGIGHTGPEVHLGLVWDDAKIDAVFDEDAAKAERGCRVNLPWFDTLDPARQAVLVAMAFQMGIDGLLKFHNTLGYVEQGRYHDAAQGMRSSAWGHQTPARVMREAQQMETGNWDPHYA